MWVTVQIIIAVVGVGFGYAFADAILHPLARAPKRTEAKAQFYLSDLLSLILLLQMPFVLFAVLAHRYPRDITFGMAAFAVAYNSLAVVLVWWLMVRFLSRRGVHGPARRTVFMVVLVPVAILGAFAFGGFVASGLLTALGPARFTASSSAKVRIWAAVLLMPLVIYPLRKLTCWVLAGAKNE